MSPKITVLMPVYNGLPYLVEAVESVLCQSFKDFEFLIVDDASTDASVACIRSYKDPRIRLVCNERNLGQVPSLNRGLKLAAGEYVARLDQDDVCLPERFRKQAAFLDARPELAAVCAWKYSIDSRGRKVRAWRNRVDNYGTFLGLLLVGKCPIWHPSVMFRRQVVDDLGGYDESYAPAEDFDLWVRMAMKRYSAAVVHQFLALQRVHQGRQSVKREEIQSRSMRRAHDRLVGALCNGPEARSVAELLRLEDGLWNQRGPKERIGAALQALKVMLANVETGLRLSAEDSATLRRVVYRRVGMGARLGDKILSLPAGIFYPLFFGLSPLLIPGVRRALAYLYGKSRELRYPRRLIQFGWERLWNRRA